MRRAALIFRGWAGIPFLLTLAIALTPPSALRTPHSLAHQVPRSEYDRNITLTVRSDGVVVTYRLELDEFTLLTTVGDPAGGFGLKPTGKLSRKIVSDAFIARMREVIPDQMVGTRNGQPLMFTCTDAKVAFTDSAQFQFTLRAKVDLPSGTHRIEVDDLNFMDKKGRLSMKVETVDPVIAESVSEVAEKRLTGIDNGIQSAAATVRVPEAPPPPKDTPAVPAEPTPEPAPSDAGTEEAAPSPGFWDLLKQVEDEENLAVLLDTNVGLGLILLLAALHGVLHSVAPGHGKTMVAAYLVGEQGTAKHAVILGLIVTLTHTSSAFAVALLLKFILPPESAPQVQRVLSLVGGALVVGIGLWLLMQRLAGRSVHAHPGSHSHGHGHSHSHGDDGGHGHSHGVTPEQFGRLGWVRLTLLGISGGIVPCWGAILWVIYCVTAGRYGLAMWAVLAFSVGLASILILIGLTVVWGGRLGARKFRGRGWFAAVTRWLPVIGAALIVVIGVWLMRVSLPK